MFSKKTGGYSWVFIRITLVRRFYWVPTTCEPQCDKTNKMACLPSLIRVFAVRIKKAWVLSYPLSAQRRLWSDWMDAQADLSLRWAHSHFFCFVKRWLMCFCIWWIPTALFYGNYSYPSIIIKIPTLSVPLSKKKGTCFADHTASLEETVISKRNFIPLCYIIAGIMHIFYQPVVFRPCMITVTKWFSVVNKPFTAFTKNKLLKSPLLQSIDITPCLLCCIILASLWLLENSYRFIVNRGQARERLGRNSRPRGQNFTLNWAQNFFLEFSSNQHTHIHKLWMKYHCSLFLLQFNVNSIYNSYFV